MTGTLTYTPLDAIPKIREELRAGFHTGKLRSIAYRKKQLLALAYMIKDNLERFEQAEKADLGRPAIETTVMDTMSALHEAKYAYDNVEKWAKDEKAPFNPNFFAMRPVIRKEAKGDPFVCIIGPFNFPVYCVFSPLAGAIAAGNASVIKLSEQTPATSALIAELVPKYLDNDLYRVVNGSIPETSKLLELQWDHIFYTGSGRVGKVVSLAAAKHLTPVSLELGGKSPCVIEESCDPALAARKILWGKTCNAGQICTAPDYVLVPRAFQDTIVEALKKQWNEFYPDANAGDFSSFGRMVTPAAYERVSGLIACTRGTVVTGGLGMAKPDEKLIPPTIVRDVSIDDSLMSEEIFGPALPIVPVDSVDEAIAFINSRERSLALYIFTKDEKVKQKVLDNTQSGGVCINETILHAAVDGLPFGGTGPSGSGYHTGIHGFNTFTHLRAKLDAPGWVDKLLSGRYPPYTEKKAKQFKKLTAEKLPPRDGSRRFPFKMLAFVLAALAAAVGTARSKGLLTQS